MNLSEEISLDKNIKHNIEIVVDRLIVKAGDREETVQIPLRQCWIWQTGF